MTKYITHRRKENDVQSEETQKPPSPEGRQAKCSYTGCRMQRGMNAYNGRKSKPDYGEFSPTGQSIAPSSTDLPFFEHKPNEPFDRYYCGCFGWE